MERQRMFKNFRCQCKACERNYPMLSEIRTKNIPPLQVVPSSKESLILCANYLNKYAKYYYPCKQLLFAEDEFGCQLEMLYRNEDSMAKMYK